MPDKRILLSSDGVAIDWPYPCAPTSTLDSKTLLALIGPDPIERCMAAATVPRFKAHQIYKGPSFQQWDQYRACGVKLAKFDCVEFARGLKGASSTLAKIILPAKSKEELRERILAAFM